MGCYTLVQPGGDWAGPQPAQAPPRCAKCNSPPINGQCTNYRIAVAYIGPFLCSFNQGFLRSQFRTAQSSNTMASAEGEPITGVWGRSPSGRAPGGESRPPWSWMLFYFCVSKGGCKFAPLLFNDASPTNLHVVTSPISTYSCPWIQTSLICAPVQFLGFCLAMHRARPIAVMRCLYVLRHVRTFCQNE